MTGQKEGLGSLEFHCCMAFCVKTSFNASVKVSFVVGTESGWYLMYDCLNVAIKPVLKVHLC